MPDPNEIADQQGLLATHRGTLRHLLQQAAAYGGLAFAPPPTRHGIAEARAGIKRCKDTLRGWGSVVEDQADDSEVLSALPTLDLPRDTIPDPAALPPISRMPLARNPLFVGREDDLKQLAATLQGGGTAAIGQIAAATGLGGIGKTNLASEFVHRYGQYFAGGVFWLSFADAAGVLGEIAACGAGLDLPGFADRKLEDQVALVRRVWQEPIPRLLVFDNCEDEALLAEWRPISGGCRVLVTSRRARWSNVLNVAALALGVLSRPESITLLRKHRPDLAADDPDLAALAAELGDLPLVLHVAGSFLARYQQAVSLKEYLAQLRSPTLLQHRSLRLAGVSPTGHDHDVGRTFALSYNRLDSSDPTDTLALSLLARAAYFAPGEPIPGDLLLSTVELGGDDAALEVEDALVRLIELGLLERAEDGALRLDRLLVVFVQAAAQDAEAQAAVEQGICWEANRLNKAGLPASFLALQGHLRFVTDRAMRRDDQWAARLCNALGHYLRMIGEYRGARLYLEQALVIKRKVLGEEHPDTALGLNNLGRLLQDVGDLSGAQPYLEQALAIQKKVLGDEHPDMAASLNNLGLLLHDMGDLRGARPYLEQALAIYKKVLGDEHPDTARSLNNLGGLLKVQGDLGSARPYYEQALAIRRKVLGEEHPDTANSLRNLGLLFYSLGDLSGARAYLEQALAIFVRVLGPDHPNTQAVRRYLVGLDALAQIPA